MLSFQHVSCLQSFVTATALLDGLVIDFDCMRVSSVTAADFESDYEKPVEEVHAEHQAARPLLLDNEG